MYEKPGMHFFCPLCEGGAMKSIKMDYDIEEKCRTFFATVNKRMEKRCRKRQPSNKWMHWKVGWGIWNKTLTSDATFPCVHIKSVCVTYA